MKKPTPSNLPLLIRHHLLAPTPTLLLTSPMLLFFTRGTWQQQHPSTPADARPGLNGSRLDAYPH